MRSLSLSLCLLTMLALPATVHANEQEWRFRVFLDDKEIGYHNFYLQRFDDRVQLRSEASFEYRLLFVKLFGYQHVNNETWEGDCLTGMESRTVVNGESYRVRGTRAGEKFLLSGQAGEAELPACSMTFAYWNPALLQQGQLINNQNGEVVSVEVSEPELVELNVRGERQPARRYVLDAGEMEIELWYSQDNQWLALETEARGGRRLRYQLL